MADKIAKNDFIELDFTAKIKDGEMFDTTNKEEAEKPGLQSQAEVKPSIISVGNKMVINGLDKSLEGKELGKEYEEEFQPEDAFGKRNPQLVRTIPRRIFREQNIQPQPGMQFNMDGNLVRIASVSGGRVLADFNNPLAGKAVIYKFKPLKKITDSKEKVNAMQEFLYKTKFEFDLNEKDKKITFKVPKGVDAYIKMYEQKFKDILGLDIEIKEQKKEEKPKEDTKDNSQTKDTSKE